MSAYLTYKLWKLGAFFVAGVVYSFIRARRRRRARSQDFAAKD